jgi:hypothetical protein
VRLGLQQEVLGAATAEDPARGASARLLGVVDDPGREIDVLIDVDQRARPSSASAATFMPIELSPGDDTKIGTALR